MREQWDQLPHEDNAEYGRFLIYRNLGPKRSLRRAYAFWYRQTREQDGTDTANIKVPHLTRQWREDSMMFHWPARASAWDVRNLVVHGARIAALHVHTLAVIAQKNLEAAQKGKPGDDAWMDILHTTKVVAEFLTPEVLREIEESHRRAIAEQSRQPLPPVDGNPALPAAGPTGEPADGPAEDPDE